MIISIYFTICTAKVSTVINNYFNRKGGDMAIGSRKQRAKQNPEENTKAVLVRFLLINPIIHQAETDKGYQSEGAREFRKFYTFKDWSSLLVTAMSMLSFMLTSSFLILESYLHKDFNKMFVCNVRIRKSHRRCFIPTLAHTLVPTLNTI